MYQGGISGSFGPGLMTTGIAGVATLQHSGSFKIMYVFAAVALAIGIISLVITTINALKHKT